MAQNSIRYAEDVTMDADDAVAETEIFPPLKGGEISTRQARTFEQQHGELAKVNSLWVISGLVNFNN